MMNWYANPADWNHALTTLSLLMLWGLTIAALTLITHQHASRRRAPIPIRTYDSTLTLHQRYTRGEIDETEYQRLLKVLDGE